MNINMDALHISGEYTQKELAALWGYKDYNAIRRGIVTPQGRNLIILFITEQKVRENVQYRDLLSDETLSMEGEEKHQSDNRLAKNLYQPIDQIYLFYRRIHHSPYVYCGEVFIQSVDLRENEPSLFEFVLAAHRDFAVDAFDIIAKCDGISEKEMIAVLEGNSKLVQHIAYERSYINRMSAIKHHGTKCNICGFDFNRMYGKSFAGSYIEVHHKIPISGGIREVNPQTDLITVCANCHRMLHRYQSPSISIDDVIDLINENRAYNTGR